jgi:hypothetical protein
METRNTIQAGTILYSQNLYYGMFNAFYRVEEVSGCMATIVELNKRTVSDDGYGQNGYETYTDEPIMGRQKMRKKIQAGRDGRQYIKISRYENAYLISEPGMTLEFMSD